MANPPHINRDPVCGKNAPEAQPQFATTYHEHTFHFCSAQCLQRFGMRPEFYGRAHGFLALPMPKAHRLLTQPVDAAVAQRACQRIAEMSGIRSVHFEANRLVLEYDLCRTTLDEIEAIANGEGVAFKEGFHGYRRRWWKYIEGNELENAIHPPSAACCNRPPRQP